MKTKQEVIDFLESKVGTTVPCVGNPSLNGQCVTLIKVLMEFIGVPNPYKARGHAKTAISAYLSEGIADPGTGFLSVFSNKNMGGGYGHIWVNAGDGDGTYYESNGVKPLIVTKGKTYVYDSVCNFDKYIGSGEPEKADMLLEYLGMPNEFEAKERLAKHLGGETKCEWGDEKESKGGDLGSERRKNNELKKQNTALTTTVESQKEQIRLLNDELENCSGSEEKPVIPEIEGYTPNGLEIEKKTDNGLIKINYRKV